MSASTRILFPLLGLLMFMGCEAKQLTQIIIVVDTDLRVPAVLDRLAIKIEHMGVTHSDLDYNLDPTKSGGAKLPATLALVPGKDPTLPVTISVTGYKDTKVLAVRQARLPFVVGRVLMLRLNLLRSCAERAKPCAAGTTCTEGGCKKIDVDPRTLPDWDEATAYTGLDSGLTPDMGTDARPPDGGLPDKAKPDKATPDKAMPDKAMPDKATPDKAMPDKATPDMTLPDKAPPDAPAMDQAILEASTPDTKVNDGQSSE